MEGGPPIFRQDCTCPALLEDLVAGFPYGAVTRSGPPFQTLPVPSTRATGLVRFRSPLLAESRLMSFPPATEMFQFAGFASRTYGFRSGYPQLPWRAGCPIRRSRDQRSLASPPGFSQRATSFIASQCQGIHQMPLLRLIPRTSSRSMRQQTAAHSGQPKGARPATAAASHEDTSGRATPAAASPRAGQSATASVTSQLSLHPVNQHPPRTRRPDPGRPLPDRNPCFSEHRHQTPEARRSNRGIVSGLCSDLRPPASVPALVEVNGIEPMTSCLQSRCSPN